MQQTSDRDGYGEELKNEISRQNDRTKRTIYYWIFTMSFLSGLSYLIYKIYAITH